MQTGKEPVKSSLRLGWMLSVHRLPFTKKWCSTRISGPRWTSTAMWWLTRWNRHTEK